MWKIPTYMEMSRDNNDKGMNLLIRKCDVTMTKKDEYISDENNSKILL